MDGLFLHFFFKLFTLISIIISLLTLSTNFNKNISLCKVYFLNSWVYLIKFFHFSDIKKYMQKLVKMYFNFCYCVNTTEQNTLLLHYNFIFQFHSKQTQVIFHHLVIPFTREFVLNDEFSSQYRLSSKKAMKEMKNYVNCEYNHRNRVKCDS